MASSPIPILASALFAKLKSNNGSKQRRIGTGCSKIDEILKGGFSPGEITCLSGDVGTGKTVLSLHILATFLLKSPNAQASIIDTTGSFDILRLHSIILAHMRSQKSELQGDNLDSDLLNANAAAVLDRVRIMNVFDLIGIIEAVNEVRDELQKADTEQADISGAQEKSHQGQTRTLQRVRSGIADSEDEDEDMLLEDSEPSSSIGYSEETSKEQDRTISSDAHVATKSPHSFGMIIIDNLSYAVAPLMRRNHSQAHSLMVPFLRSLANLTQTHDLITILISGTLSQGSDTTQQAPIPPNPSPSVKDSHQYSIFSSNTVRPALGRSFPYYVDLHLLLSSLPKTAKDAQALYRSSHLLGRTNKSEMVNVVEVAADRYGDMFGRWASFSIAGEVGELLK